MNEEQKKKIETEVDLFIVKWCGDNAPHLIDSDENDGEKLRQELISITELALKSQQERYLEEIEKMKKDTTMISDIFEGKEIGLNCKTCGHAEWDCESSCTCQPYNEALSEAIEIIKKTL